MYKSRLTTDVLIGLVFMTVLQSLLLLLIQDIMQLKINLVLQLGLLIAFGYWSYMRSGTYLNAPFIFVLAIYFWHSTFLTGYYFDLAEIFEYTGSVFTYGEAYVPKASAMVALSMSFSVLGSFFGYSQQKQKTKIKRQLVLKYSGKLLDNSKMFLYKYLGKFVTQYAWLSFLVFALVSFVYLIFEGYATFGKSYMSLYTDYSGSFLYRFYQSTKFFGVLVILMIFAAVKTRRGFALAFAMTAGLIFINLLMGSRSMPFIYAVAVLISIDCFFKRISWSLLVALVLIASAMSFIIDQSRVFGVGLQVLNFSQTGRSIDFLHFFWNSGGTIRTVLRTMEFSADTGYLYGQSIIDAIIYLLPKAIVDGVGLNTGFIRPSEWIIENSADVPSGGGLGYSLVAEVYLNFGIAGSLIFALVGWFLAKKFYDYVFNHNRFAALHAFNVAIIFSYHMRSDMMAYLRVLVYGFIFIEILRTLQKKSYSRLHLNFHNSKQDLQGETKKTSL